MKIIGLCPTTWEPVVGSRDVCPHNGFIHRCGRIEHRPTEHMCRCGATFTLRDVTESEPAAVTHSDGGEGSSRNVNEGGRPTPDLFSLPSGQLPSQDPTTVEFAQVSASLDDQVSRALRIPGPDLRGSPATRGDGPPVVTDGDPGLVTPGDRPSWDDPTVSLPVTAGSAVDELERRVVFRLESLERAVAAVETSVASLHAALPARPADVPTGRTDAPRGISRGIVLAACGHWWRESRPEGFRPTSPRVCTTCPLTHPAVVGTSPQGLALVSVEYVSETGMEAS